jgi:hypothetical protein
MIATNRSFQIPECILWRIDDGKAVLFNENEGHPFLLNHTATQIWQMIYDGKSVAIILEELCRVYQNTPPERIKEETIQILEDLCMKQILE